MIQKIKCFFGFHNWICIGQYDNTFGWIGNHYLECEYCPKKWYYLR